MPALCPFQVGGRKDMDVEIPEFGKARCPS
jgi:hypothetical protein